MSTSRTADVILKTAASTLLDFPLCEAPGPNGFLDEFPAKAGWYRVGVGRKVVCVPVPSQQSCGVDDDQVVQGSGARHQPTSWPTHHDSAASGEAMRISHRDRLNPYSMRDHSVPAPRLVLSTKTFMMVGGTTASRASRCRFAERL